MRKTICILLALGLMLGSAHALTGEWDAIARVDGSEDTFLVRRDGLWGMIDREGKVLIKPQFDEEPQFSGGYAEVAVPDPNPRPGFSGEEEYGHFYGIISVEGEIVVPPEYFSLQRSADGSMIRYELGETYHFLNLETGEKLPGSYDRAKDFVGDYAAVGMLGEQIEDNLSAPEVVHWGTIDRSGKMGIPMDYDSLEVYEDGIAIVELNRKHGYMHADGREITRCKYDYIRPFAHGVGVVGKIIGENESNNGSEPYISAWGAVDEEGNEILPCEYDEVKVVHSGLITAEVGSAMLEFEVQDGKAIALDGASIAD